MATPTIPAPTAGAISPTTLDAIAAAVFDCTDAASLRAFGVRVIQHAQAVQALNDGRKPTPGNLIIEARNVAPVILSDAVGIRCVLLANDGRWRYRWSVDIRRDADGTEANTHAHDWQCHRTANGPGAASWTPWERLPPADWFTLHDEAVAKFRQTLANRGGR